MKLGPSGLEAEVPCSEVTVPVFGSPAGEVSSLLTPSFNTGLHKDFIAVL